MSFQHLYSSEAVRIGVLCHALVGIFCSAFFLARRTADIRLLSVSSWSARSPALLATLANYSASAAFFVTSTILQFGIGVNGSSSACEGGFLSCIGLYSLAKLGQFVFLMERVHIVQISSKPRLRSPLYRCMLVLMTPIVAIPLIMILGRHTEVDGQNVCRWGLSRIASIPLVAYDFVLVSFLTGAFIVPLVSSSRSSPALRRLAIHSLIASILAMMTTGANSIFIILRPLALSHACFLFCGSDLLVSSWILFFATKRVSRDNDNEAREERAIEVIRQASQSHLTRPSNVGSSGRSAGLASVPLGTLSAHPLSTVQADYNDLPDLVAVGRPSDVSEDASVKASSKEDRPSCEEPAAFSLVPHLPSNAASPAAEPATPVVPLQPRRSSSDPPDSP